MDVGVDVLQAGAGEPRRGLDAAHGQRLPCERLLDVGQARRVRARAGQADSRRLNRRRSSRPAPPPRRRWRSATRADGAWRRRPHFTGVNWTPTMISSAARSTVNRPRKKSLRLHRARALRALDVDVGVEREHHRRVVGGGIGVGQAAAERAAIADLRIADLRRGLGDHRDRPAAATRMRPRRGGPCRRRSRSRPSFSRMPDRPGMRAMSISVSGSLSRSFMSGTRLWPPAMSLPSPLAARSFASASSSDVARLYSNVVEITSRASLDDAPQFFGPEHHVDVLDAELAERVDRRGDDARRRAERAGFAHAFGAERIDRRRRHRGVELEAREIDRARNARSP